MSPSALKFHRGITLERFDKFTSKDFFADVNLTSCLIKFKSEAAVQLQAYQVPDLKRITFQEALKGEYSASKVGDTFGPTWTTIWFKVVVTPPAELKDEAVWLSWDSDSEAMFWTVDGTPMQGFTGGNGWDKRHNYPLTSSFKMMNPQKL